MNWKEWLAKFRLVEMNYSPKGDQNGILNIKMANNTFINPLIFTDAEAARAYAEGIAANKAKITEDAEKRLMGISGTIQILPDPVAAQFANATIVASSAAVSGVEGKVKIAEIQIADGETLGLSEKATVKLSSEEQSKK
jgi:hypothetical protein